MIAFEVYLNGNKLCVAGIEELGGVSAVLTWKRGPHVLKETHLRDNVEYSEIAIWGDCVQCEPESTPHLGHGFKYAEHLEWITQEFPPGSEVTIKAVEASTVDKPRSRTPTGSDDYARRAYEKSVRQMVEALGWKVLT